MHDYEKKSVYGQYARLVKQILDLCHDKSVLMVEGGQEESAMRLETQNEITQASEVEE